MLGCINLASAFVVMIPLFIDLGKIATGLDEFDDYTITLLEENTEMQVNGGIAFGLAEAVQKELDKAPSVSVIHLNSIGGRVVEARKLRDLIVQRGLSTYTELGCNSACVVAFIAGKMRVLNQKAKLGFHRYSPLGGLAEESIEDQMRIDKLYFKHVAGIDRRFVEKAFSTPSDDVWYPSIDELIEAGVVTHTFDGSEMVDWR